MRISSAAMANAMREISIDQGLDPREMTLLPFGGAGPLMGTLLADELGMSRIVVPPLAGNFSAWGLLGADMVQSAARTRILDFVPGNAALVEGILSELFATLGGRSEAHAGSAVRSARLDLRYKGQEHWLSVEVPLSEEGRLDEGVPSIRDRFVAEYTRTFGATMNDEVELVSIRASTTVPLPRRELSYTPGRSDGEAGEMEAYSFARKGRVPFRILPRGRVEGRVEGPAIVTEETTTTYVDVGWTIANGSAGELILERVSQ
jgi:N-methylhydantoinase A